MRGCVDSVSMGRHFTYLEVSLCSLMVSAGIMKAKAVKFGDQEKLESSERN